MFYQGLVPIEESDYEDFAIEILIALAFLFKNIRARVSDHQYETIFFQISSRTNLLSILALYLNTSYFLCLALWRLGCNGLYYLSYQGNEVLLFISIRRKMREREYWRLGGAMKHVLGMEKV